MADAGAGADAGAEVGVEVEVADGGVEVVASCCN